MVKTHKRHNININNMKEKFVNILTFGISIDFNTGIWYYDRDGNFFFRWEEAVKGQGYSAIYVLNIIFQALFTMVWYIGLFMLFAFLLVRFFHCPEWVYAPAIIIGVAGGFSSMIRFILAACRSLDRIEEERQARQNKNKKNNSK